MWPFTKKSDSSTLIDNPRYKNNPVLLLLEIFVLDVIGRLSPEKRKAIQELNIKKIFSTRADHWKPALREVLKLSNTLETAILDRWTRLLADNNDSEATIQPESFAKEFTDDYFKQGSQIDVWEAGALELAKDRIAEYRKKGLLTLQSS